jgi:hypothetical protein
MEIYAKARGISPSRVATIIFSSGAMYRRLTDGADITVGRFEDAVQWFSDNWPAGVEWPEGIRRPAPKAPEAA